MKILFICKHNRFRSKVAEAFYSLMKKSDDKVISRGIKLSSKGHLYVSDYVIDIMKEIGFPILNKESRLINAIDLSWADKIIIVANDVDPRSFPKEKTIVWPVEDCSEEDKSKIKNRVKLIESHIKDFILNSS